MKILCVGSLPPHPGGSAISCGLLLSGFAAAGHSVSALAPIAVGARDRGNGIVPPHPAIRVTRFQVPFFEVAPNLPSGDEYRRTERVQIRGILPLLIRSERPDIIFVGRETFAWDVPDLAQAHSIPCVLRTAGSTTLGILDGTLPDAEAHGLLDQYRRADLIVSPAEHLAARLRPLGLGAVRVIWNAVDASRFAPRPKDPQLLRELRIHNEDIVVAHVSNLKSLKRPLDLVDAADTALRADPRLLYLIVGDGPCRHAMEAACREKGILGRFRFTGWIDHDRVPDYINLGDVVVLPSEAEAQARVYLETQACGRVILASDIPAAREVIEDGETGVLFRMGDARDLAAKTLHLARDPAARAAIGSKARSRIHAHALPMIVRAYLDTFAEVVDGRG